MSRLPKGCWPLVRWPISGVTNLLWPVSPIRHSSKRWISKGDRTQAVSGRSPAVRKRCFRPAPGRGQSGTTIRISGGFLVAGAESPTTKAGGDLRRHILLSVGFSIALIAGATAQSASLKPALSGISFLVGTWTGGTGKVADTGGTSRGSSTITAEVGGSVLIRRDHTDLFGADGKPSGSFEQVMMIYPEGGTLHADYSDGEHIIHYTSAAVVPGRSVVFTTAASAGAPSFRLRYEKADAQTLAIRFEMAPPGQTDFHAIATGTLRKSSS